MSVTIDGVYMDRSLHDFQRACEHCIANEHEKPLPDAHLIELLCDAVRLSREVAQKDATVNNLAGRLMAAHEELRQLRRSVASA